MLVTMSGIVVTGYTPRILEENCLVGIKQDPGYTVEKQVVRIYRDSQQTSASGERFKSYAANILANCDVGQAGAAGKHKFQMLVTLSGTVMVVRLVHKANASPLVR